MGAGRDGQRVERAREVNRKCGIQRSS